MSATQIEKKRFYLSLVFPLFFLSICWLIKISEYVFEINLSTLGVYPLKLKGVPGIFLSPLIHGDFNHLIANSIPLLTLSIGLFYFYHKISYKIFFLIYIITGIWVWFGAREAYHIGASGVVYGLASFIFVSGVIRNSVQLMSIALIVVFLYGSMVWGILPIEEGVSWESHLLGSVSGLILAIIYRKEGPKRIKFEWEDEDDDEKDKSYNSTICTYKDLDLNYYIKEEDIDEDTKN